MDNLKKEYKIAFLIGYGYKLEEVQKLTDEEINKLIESLLNQLDEKKTGKSDDLSRFKKRTV